MRDRTPHSPSPAREAALSRRSLLRGAAAVGALGAASTALTGCGNTIAQGFTAGAPESRRLNFWNPFTGGDGIRMVAMQEEYKKKHGDTTLKAATFVWGGPYYTKLTLATLGRRPPQVAVAHLSKVPTLAEAGLLSELDPAALDRAGMPEANFDANAWSKSHREDKLYAIPLDTHPFVLYFHSEVAQKAGLLDSSGQMTDLDGPDKFVDALKAAKEVTGEWGGSVASIKDASTQYRLFLSFYHQLTKTPLVTDQGTKVTLDMAAAEEALAFIRRLTLEDKVIPTGTDGAGAITLLTTGKAGFLMDGVWQVIAVQDSKIKFDMRPLPRIFTDAPYACFADSHALVLPTAPSADAQRLDLSLEFVRSMLGSSQLWAEGGHVPAWLPTQQTDAYKALGPQSHYAEAATGAVYDAVAWYGGAGSTLQIQVGDAVTSVFTGARSPRAGAEAMRSRLRKQAATPSPI